MTKNIYTIHESAIKVNEFPFTSKGSFQLLKQGMILDIEARSLKSSNLQNIIALLPNKYTSQLKSLNCKGNISFKGTLQGKFDKYHVPKTLFAFAIADGSISEDNKNIQIKKISFHATLTNYALHVSKCTGSYKDNIFSMNMKMTNFKNPYIQLNTHGILPLGLFSNPENEMELNGDMKMTNIKIYGNLAKIQHSNFENVNASGTIDVNNGIFGYHNQSFNFKTHSNFNNQNIEISPLNIVNPDFNLKITGNVSNYLGYLYKSQPLNVNLNTSFDKLDLDDFNKKLNKYKSTTAANTSTRNSNQSDHINLQVNVAIHEFSRKKLRINDLVLKLASEQKDLYYIKAVGKTMNGIATADGKLSMGNEIKFAGKSRFENVDFKELFRQFDNFDQIKITSNNISGTADSKMILDLVWTKDGELPTSKQHIIGDLFVKNGTLQNIKALESFSKFVKAEDLRNIKFSNFENWFEIKDNKIILPETFLQSNALNLAISGYHKFDNTFNYGIEVNAGQVFINKLKKHDPSLAPIPAKRHSFFSLYYNMNGSFDSYDFRMSKSLVTVQFESSQALKKRIIADLAAAFGAQKNENVAEIYKEQATFISQSPLKIPIDTIAKPISTKLIKSSDDEEDEFLPGFD